MTSPAFNYGGLIQTPATLTVVSSRIAQNRTAITNFTNESVVLNAGTMIVVAETVDPPSKTSEPTIYWPSHAEEEKELEMREEGLYVKSLKLKVAEEVENEELPEHLEKLYNESVKSVHNATDRQMIKNLLLDHQEVFCGSTRVYRQ
jgi:hypothetical protein